MKRQEDVRELRLALGVYVLVFAMKLVVYLLTGVVALFAEALHTLSDIFVSGFLLVAAIWSHKEADALHMFGYGRAQNVGALVTATLFISFTSFELYKEAIPRLFNPAEKAYQNLWLALGVIIISMLITAAPLLRLLTRKARSAATRAQLLELYNDELGLLAALIGTVFIFFGQPLADPVAAIFVATIIAYNGVRLFLENSSILLGRSPAPEYLAEVERLVRSVPGVLGLHNLRAEYIGPGIVHIGMHIEVQPRMLIEEADRIAEEVLQRVHQHMPSGYCFIHVDPARISSNPFQNGSAIDLSSA